jgi:hypothetical protein
MFVESQSQALFYKKMSECCCVMIVSNYFPQTIQVFRLAVEEFLSFCHGTVALVPHGCCNASGGKAIGNPAVLWEGKFTSSAQVVALVRTFENTLLQEGRPKCK